MLMNNGATQMTATNHLSIIAFKMLSRAIYHRNENLNGATNEEKIGIEIITTFKEEQNKNRWLRRQCYERN